MWSWQIAAVCFGPISDRKPAPRVRLQNMATKISNGVVRDIRFPTSATLAGSDAMNPDPDYSATYVTLETDSPRGLKGNGLAFTNGRGNEVCVAAVHALEHHLVDQTLESLVEDLGGFWHRITSDSQVRWLGPEKGVMHLATAALVNAVWDLYAKAESKPLWKLLVDMTAAEIVSCIPFRHITDALTPKEATEILKRNEDTKNRREQQMLSAGYPAYTTSVGWLGYTDQEVRDRVRAGLAQGWTHFKMKVGRNLEEDVGRARLMREQIGSGCKLMMDANQVWDVDQAIIWMERLAEFDPYWIEEPTSPDDVLGHAKIARAIAPIGVATGEHCQNRVVFKQMMQADAIRFCQIDSCRLGGVNEVLAVLLMAAKFGVPVCPHAGGVGLCEYVQHLSIFDYIAMSGSLENRRVEFVDHLHEHFVYPVEIREGNYVAPLAPGYSIEMKPESIRQYEFPDGVGWKS